MRLSGERWWGIHLLNRQGKILRHKEKNNPKQNDILKTKNMLTCVKKGSINGR